METPKIKGILIAFGSKMDRNGNRYWAMRYIDTQTGKSAEGIVSGGESNVRVLIRALGLEWDEVFYTVHDLPIREWNRMTKKWQYAGCREEEIIAHLVRRSVPLPKKDQGDIK